MANPLKIYTADASFYEGYMQKLAEEAAAGFAPACERLIAHAPRFQHSQPGQIPAAKPDVDDARWVCAREHGFADWPSFAERLHHLSHDEGREPFIAFIHACEAGDAQQVRHSLDQHPDLVDYDCSTHKTPLHSAGSAEVARVLIEAGAPLAYETPLAGGTALAHALIWGWTDIAELIAGRELAPANLRVAAGLGRMDLLRAMFSADGDLKPQARQGRAYYRANYGWYAWAPADDDQEILDEGLIYAATNGRIEAMEYLVARGAAVNGKAYETTALLRAAWKGRRAAVDWLLDRGADIDGDGWLGGHAQGTTPLHMAAAENNHALIEHLLARGADPARRDALYGGTPDGWAAHRGFDEAAAIISSARGQ